MRKKLVVAAAIGTVAAIVVWSSSAGTPRATGYEPVLDPADFTTAVDNPYFPLPVGRVWVYTGTKDGQSQVDRVTVTSRTKKVAEGIVARVVTDVATHRGKLLEKTEDWYAQDKHGNVWYVGEKTAAYSANGTVDRSGSWEAGVDDAEPGLIMPADPRVPQSYRQEYYRGEAEDTAWIVHRGGSVTVPSGTHQGALTTLEATRIEPGAYDLKVYARGIGIVRERALTGGPEVAELVRMTG
jgi:hypothetical protein